MCQFALWRAENTELTFAGGKNNLYYISAGSNHVQILAGTRKSVGGIQNEKINFENQYLTLPKGSLVYMGSDG